MPRRLDSAAATDRHRQQRSSARQVPSWRPRPPAMPSLGPAPPTGRCHHSDPVRRHAWYGAPPPRMASVRRASRSMTPSPAAPPCSDGPAPRRRDVRTAASPHPTEPTTEPTPRTGAATDPPHRHSRRRTRRARSPLPPHDRPQYADSRHEDRPTSQRPLPQPQSFAKYHASMIRRLPESPSPDRMSPAGHRPRRTVPRASPPRMPNEFRRLDGWRHQHPPLTHPRPWPHAVRATPTACEQIRNSSAPRRPNRPWPVRSAS